ncbi:MAG TPA: hypothetical protein VIY68_21275 [Steroidobacteraceae bacterium]
MTLSERAYRRSGQWKAVGIALVIPMTGIITEWLVTYCAFSSNCPAVEKIADCRLAKLMAVAGAGKPTCDEKNLGSCRLILIVLVVPA